MGHPKDRKEGLPGEGQGWDDRVEPPGAGERADGLARTCLGWRKP